MINKTEQIWQILTEELSLHYKIKLSIEEKCQRTTIGFTGKFIAVQETYTKTKIIN